MLTTLASYVAHSCSGQLQQLHCVLTSNSDTINCLRAPAAHLGAEPGAGRGGQVMIVPVLYTYKS